MKRLLSLLVVIAMVVAMIPSVFATKEEVDFDELTGRLVVLEDIGTIEVVLAEGSDGMVYQWTPDANYNLSLSYTAPEGTEIAVTVTQGETSAAAVDGAVSMDVWAEQVVEIEVSEAAALAAEFTISGEAWAVPGSDEWNGIFLGNTENTVTAAGTTFSGSTTWYQGYFSGTVMTITGTGAYNVIYNGETIAAVDGVVSTAVASSNPRMPVVFAIDTVGEYTIKFEYPAGSQMNPAQLVIGENTASIEAGAQGYYYNWTAEKEGTLTITMPSDMGWSYVINNMTTYVYGDTQWSDSDPVVNPATVEVAAGDMIEIIVNTYDPADMWNTPAGDLVFTAAFAEPEPDVPALTITAQPEDTLVDLGVVGVMTVEVEGEVSKYQWQVSSDGGETWKNTTISGYNTNALNVPGTTARHKMMFRCVITPVEGEAVTSEPATHYVAFLETRPANYRVSVGDNATFTAKWSVDGATYRWEYMNATDTEWKETTATIASNRFTDTITVVAKANRNLFKFRCIITYNGVETIATPANAEYAQLLLWEEAPVLNAQPESTTVRSGDRAVFTVEATGVNVQYQWMCKRPGDQYWFFTKLTGYNTNTLTVRAYDVRNGYQYKCKVTTPMGNNFNEVDSDPVTLTILPAADITTQPQNVTAAAGTTAVFTIVAEGENLTYQWQWSKNGKTFANVKQNGTSATLEVEATAARNGYYYRCVVRNANYTDGAGYGFINSEKAQLTVE